MTVGIALRTSAGGTRTRWLKAFDRLGLVFGEKAATHLPFLLRHAQELVDRHESPDSPELHFGDARAVWDSDFDAVADSLFHRFVPLARHIQAPAAHGTVQNRSLQRSVYRYLKDTDDPRLWNLIPQKPQLEAPDEPKRTLFVPLQGTDRFATLVSAQATKTSTIDRNVYPAVAQLNAAARLHRIKRTAVFLLKPDDESMSEQEYTVLDEHIHQTMYVLKSEGVTVMSEISIPLIGDAVKSWALD